MRIYRLFGALLVSAGLVGCGENIGSPSSETPSEPASANQAELMKQYGESNEAPDIKELDSSGTPAESSE